MQEKRSDVKKRRRLEDSRKKKMKWMTLARRWSNVQEKEEAARTAYDSESYITNQLPI